MVNIYQGFNMSEYLNKENLEELSNKIRIAIETSDSALINFAAVILDIGNKKEPIKENGILETEEDIVKKHVIKGLI
jgi:hypothetical protein